MFSSIITEKQKKRLDVLFIQNPDIHTLFLLSRPAWLMFLGLTIGKDNSVVLKIKAPSFIEGLIVDILFHSLGFEIPKSFEYLQNGIRLFDIPKIETSSSIDIILNWTDMIIDPTFESLVDIRKNSDVDFFEKSCQLLVVQ